ncbi:hypothetical protein predicted by Glimmer/Critica [Acetobacter ghanensis]|uniref:Uncharacterized protein n=1 Tax=Acetobacter ghanensis TaxID=431306 RepID=A0A0U5F2L8_9PROT|nr:hypothetical protein predicted by Glimmer/Critica [Acetobacter ghanensis]
MTEPLPGPILQGKPRKMPVSFTLSRSIFAG